jgi:L-malate glycosyltransferase
MGERWPVLLMVRELGLGGSERQTALMAASLGQSGFDPRVGCFRAEGIRRADLDVARVPVVEFPVRSFGSLSAFRGARQLVRYIREQRISLVHAFDYPTALLLAWVAPFCRRTRFLSSQRSHRELNTAWTRRALRVTDRMMDAVVVNCAFLQKHLVEQERVPALRVRLCHNGIDTNQFHPGPRSVLPGFPEDAVVVGVVSALRPEKDLPTLLRAFAVARQVQPAIKLLLVGDGSERAGLRSLADELNVTEHCLFAPATAEVAGWLHAIDVFVLPSVSEAFSNSLMEAMACGCAVVASRVGGNPEMVRHQETGLLFEAGDVEGLAECLTRLAGGTGLRESLARSAAAEIRDRFSSRTAALRLGDVYRELIERGAIWRE